MLHYRSESPTNQHKLLEAAGRLTKACLLPLEPHDKAVLPAALAARR